MPGEEVQILFLLKLEVEVTFYFYRHFESVILSQLTIYVQKYLLLHFMCFALANVKPNQISRDTLKHVLFSVFPG